MRSYIDNLTRAPQEKRDQLAKWYSKQGEATRLEVSKIQGELTRKFRSQIDQERLHEFHYSMLMLAINRLYWLDTAMAQKASLSPEQAQKITEQSIERIKAKKKRKPSLKRTVIAVQYFKEIELLREKGLSWREVAEYIKKRHKTTFGWSYLRKCYTEMVEERTVAGVAND